MAKLGPIGSRGCPSCGGHNTERVRTKGGRIYFCLDCRHRWEPCTTVGCRGYRLALEPTPMLLGCKDCGVPDKLVALWPEAWRAMARELDNQKQSSLVKK